MKDKIKKFLSREPSVVSEKELKELTLEEEVKHLRKENKVMHSKLSDAAISKFKSRRSIRKFSTTPIDFKIIYEIIEAGLNAPAAGNIQNYRIIVIEDRAKKIEVAKIALQQYWIADAPYILAIVREDSELLTLYPGKGAIYSIQNVAAVIENIIMATHFYDLGACWIESGDNDVLKEALKIPEGHTVDALIPIGHPLEHPQIRKNPIVSMVYFEKWGEKSK